MKKYKKLRVRMTECEVTQKEVGKAAGLCPSAMSARMQGKAPFTSWEMVSIGKFLEIPAAAFHDYFFEEGVKA